MRLFALLMLASSPAMAETVIAVSVFNAAEYVLYSDKGDCVDGHMATVTSNKKTISACWTQKDGVIYVDINSVILAVPRIQFTAFLPKTFS